MNLIFIFLIAGFIGGLSTILPSLFLGASNEGNSIEEKSGANLGYEEVIRVNIDRYGNLTVQGSFQGPQITPNVDWSLPEYDYIYMLQFDVVNPNTRDYFYQRQTQVLNPALPMNDVYLHILFLTDDINPFVEGMANPVILNPTQMQQVASIIKTDLERAFGISNNFSADPIGTAYYQSYTKIITYGFNFSTPVNYNYFIQFLQDHTPAGLADSFAPNRIRNTDSWLNWFFTNNWYPGLIEKVAALSRSPLGDYNTSFECNIFLQYPQFFGTDYPSTEETFNLSEVVDAPFIPLIDLTESAYSSSEIEILVENGNITSDTSSQYHIPRYQGLDHDWWLLRNTTLYNTQVTGLGNVSDIQISFTAPVIAMNILTPPPPPATVNGLVNIVVTTQTALAAPSWLFAEIFDEATFQKIMFDDFAYQYSVGYQPITFMTLGSVVEGIYMGVWNNSYRYPNGNYYIYIAGQITELSRRTPRSFFMGNVYNFSRFTLNNPIASNLTVISPLGNQPLSKNVNISIMVTNPELIKAVTYEIINHSQYFLPYILEPVPMVNGSLINRTTNWSALWDSTTVPSTYDYILRIKVTDANDTFFTDRPITVQNTLFQENVPLYAPMGGSDPNYDLNIGTIVTPPTSPGGGGEGGPGMHAFFGYGVNFGMDFRSLLYRDVVGVLFMADNPHTTNPVWDMMVGLPEFDYGMSIMMPDNSPATQLTADAIMHEAVVAFNLPTDLPFIGAYPMEMGGGSTVYFFVYGANYSSITYGDFVDKFHLSVPSGLAALFTRENMTQADLNSSLMFGWMNPTGPMGSMYAYSPYRNYDFGLYAFISPTIWIPNYFNSSLGATNSFSLKALFPQIPQIKACAPTVASTVLSGFGPNFLGAPFGAVVLNANITDWYPTDPFMVNVTPFSGYPIPSTLNLITFTLLNTEETPYGLLSTDDIRVNFTGPFIKNNLLSPTPMQSIQLEDCNMTVELQGLAGGWDRVQYDLRPVGYQQSYLYGDLHYNGQNWTQVISSTDLPAGAYQLNVYVRDTLSIWALNRTIFYVNNTAQITRLDIYINERGGVEIGYGITQSPFPGAIGYGIDLGIVPKIFNLSEILDVEIYIASENTFNQLALYGTSTNWNVLVIINGWASTPKARLREIASPIIADLERVFNISGMLNELEDFQGTSRLRSDRIAFAMNYTIGRDYLYFLDHYETVRSGNLSNLVSKENLLRANQSYISYYIYPDWIRPFVGLPPNYDMDSLTWLSAWMCFDKVYDYTLLNQTHYFSLAEFLDVHQLNADEECGMTLGRVDIYSNVACGYHIDVYPNHPIYTWYDGFYDGFDHYRYQLLYKDGHDITGIISTDDIRFNFTAPYTSIQVLTPLPDSTIHGVVEIRVNATMLQPALNDVTLFICPAGTFQMDLQGFMQMPSIKTLSFPYDPVELCWRGYWETLTDQIPNGWYDLIFEFEDALGKFQQDYCRVHVYNTYYRETLGVVVEQDGNVSASFNFEGNIIKANLDYSLPEYQQIMMLSMMAFNAYTGHNNYSKKLLSLGFQFPECDYGVSILISPEYSPAEALSIAIPIKNDVERAFGLPGQLKYLQTAMMSIPTGAAPISMRVVSFGNNYSASLTYDYFIDRFHQHLPSGLNNSLPANTLKGTDSNLMWALFMGGLLAQRNNPPNIDYAPLNMMAKLFYPHYVAGDFMSGTLTSHSLSLCDLLNIPQFFHGSTDIADCMESNVVILVQNANITKWYPNIPFVSERNGETYYSATPATANRYESWDKEFDNRIYSYAPWDDINVTFDEPMLRPIFLTPLSGTVVDGIVNVSVLVQNAVGIAEVQLKIYSEAEFSKLDVNKVIGGGGTMPNVRPEGMYGYQTMTNVGGGVYNYTWLAYQHPDGPIWLEVVVSGYGGQYAFNSTRVIISSSNPLAINVLSPINGQIVTGPIEIVAQVVNSTDLMMVFCQIVDESGIETPQYIAPVPRGGSIYSAYWGSQGVSNGTYLLGFMVLDENFAVALNFSVKIEVRNPFPIEITIISPISTLDWTDSGIIEAIATGPYHIMGVEYSIDVQYFSPNSHQWESYIGYGSGHMVDPASVWMGTYDSTYWEYKVAPYGSVWYDAAYLVTLTASDTANGVCSVSKRFTLELPRLQFAEITYPSDFDYVGDIFNVDVSVTDPRDSMSSLNGILQRASDGVAVAELEFILSPDKSFGSATVYSYIYPNDYYDIIIWGKTLNGSFYDCVRVQISNYPVLSVESVTPGTFDTLTGVVTVQLQIDGPYSLTNIQAEIYAESSYSYITFLDMFVYNPLSGFYEQQLTTSYLPDGNYRIECYVEDIYSQEVMRVVHFSIDNPPHVTLMAPINGSLYEEYETITIAAAIPDADIFLVELWVNNTFIMEFTRLGINWVAEWSYSIGWAGIDYLQVRAYDFYGLVNDTEWLWVIITPYTPPAKHADLYDVATTNTAGEEQFIFTEGETVEYHSTIRGDAASSTYVVTAQTDDPFLQGYLQYNESVTVTAGLDVEVVFSFSIGLGAPVGIYVVQVIMWTDWPWNGGICVDFITIIFEVI